MVLLLVRRVMANPDRVAIRYLSKIAKEHSSPEALKKYLQSHPKADPKKHTVKKPSGEKKPTKEKPDSHESEDLAPLKGLSEGDRKRVLEQALEDMDAEETGRKPKQLKDVSKDEGFEALKGLSPSEQQKVIQKALESD
jgi:hypothetical protein